MRISLVALLSLALFSPAAQKPSRPSFEDVSKRAAAAREANRIDEAIGLYRRAVAQRPNWSEGWWYLGTLLYEQDRYSEARDALLRLVAQEPRGGPGWALLGLCQYQVREYDRAVISLQRARMLGLSGNDQLVYVASYHLALLLTRFEQYEVAFDILFGLGRNRPDHPAIIEALGLALLRLPFLPNELPPARRELVLKAGRAAAYSAERRMDEADREYRELVERFAKEPNVHYAAGIFFLQGEPDKAIDQFREELKVSPSHVAARLQIAFEYIRRGQYEAGLPFAREAVDLDPRSFAARNALGRILLETGQTEAALKELEKGKELAPDSPEMRFALARAYRRAGQTKEAERERAEFTRLNQIRRARREGPQAVGGIQIPSEEPPR